MNAAARTAIAATAGGAVAVCLGVYGRLHQPTGQSIWTGPFTTVLGMKAWLATIVAALAVWQLASALWMFGRLSRKPPPAWVRRVHRVTGATAFIVSLPVAYACLWSLGFQDYTPRVLAHSILGCLFYGVFATKMLALHIRGVSPRLIPVAGGLLFTTVIALWFTSSWWYFNNAAFPGW